MDSSVFHSIYTVIMLVTFVGIWVWAWSAKRRRAFDEAARLPLDDQPAGPAPKREEAAIHE